MVLRGVVPSTLRAALSLLALGIVGACALGPPDGCDLALGASGLVVGGERVEGRVRFVPNDGSAAGEDALSMEWGGYSVDVTSDAFLDDGGAGAFTPWRGSVATPTDDGFSYESGAIERAPGEPRLLRLDLEFEQWSGGGPLDLRFTSISVEGAVRF